MRDAEQSRHNQVSGLQKAVIILSGGLFTFSLFQPAFYINRADYDTWANSKLLVLFGWSSILGGGAIGTFIWLANPLYFISIILLIKQRSLGLYLGIIASLLALSFSLLDSIITSETGSYSKIASLEDGYFLWVASMLTLAIGTALERWLNE